MTTEIVRPRTAAATAARQRSAARRSAIRLGVEQVGHLDDQYLIALAMALAGEVERRGLEVPADLPAVRRAVEHDGPAVEHEVSHSDVAQEREER